MDEIKELPTSPELFEWLRWIIFTLITVVVTVVTLTIVIFKQLKKNFENQIDDKNRELEQSRIKIEELNTNINEINRDLVPTMKATNELISKIYEYFIKRV